MKNIRALLMATTLLTGVGACSLIPDYERPDVKTPASFQRESNAAAVTEQTITADWWTRFNSSELNMLMDQALVENNDLRAGIARIEQARASARIARSALFPTIDATAGASRRIGNNNSNNLAVRSSGRSSWNAGLNVAYELDLFGANRAAAEAAEADIDASIYNQEALKLVTMADVAQSYFAILNLRERVRIAEDNLKVAREVMRLVDVRFQAGAASALDVAQQRTNLSNTEANLASLRQSLAVSEDAFSVLMGRPVQEITISAASLDGLNVPRPATVQPSSLLERRPDIRAAEASLIAANADIGAARAAFLPTIGLSVAPGLTAIPFSGPVVSGTTLAASLAAPIFSAGALEGGVELSEARKAELIENYRKAVLVALQETEDALSATETSQQRMAALQNAVNEARRAYNLSNELYKAGATDFQPLLDAQRSLLQAEDAYATARLDMLNASVDLYKALGGGWQSGGHAAPAAPISSSPPAQAPMPMPASPPAPAPDSVKPLAEPARLQSAPSSARDTLIIE